MDKILVVGGNGFVGGQLCKMGKAKGYRVAIADISGTCAVGEYEYHRCDIGDYAAMRGIFEDSRPSLVVNVAAVADIDLAQLRQSLAYTVNVTGAENCACAAKEIGARYIWFSSDAVFDGMAEGYTEDSRQAPVNYYGETKVLGEQRVLAACPEAIILRLSLVLGMPLAAGNSFLAGMIEKLRCGEQVLCPVDEVRTPVDVLTLCEAIYELYSMDFRGVLHIGSTSSVSRYEMSGCIAQKLQFDPTQIVPLYECAPGKAPRHKNGSISVEKAQRILKHTAMLPWQKTVERAVSMITDGGAEYAHSKA